MDESEIRGALDRHWAASDANVFDVEHDIYREDAVLIRAANIKPE